MGGQWPGLCGLALRPGSERKAVRRGGAAGGGVGQQRGGAAVGGAGQQWAGQGSSGRGSDRAWQWWAGQQGAGWGRSGAGQQGRCQFPIFLGCRTVFEFIFSLSVSPCPQPEVFSG